MTAGEVATTLEQPLSTVYRKLDRLSDTSLVTSTRRISSDGHHPCQYQSTVEHVHVQLSAINNDVLDVDVSEGPHESD